MQTELPQKEEQTPSNRVESCWIKLAKCHIQQDSYHTLAAHPTTGNLLQPNPWGLQVWRTQNCGPATCTSSCFARQHHPTWHAAVGRLPMHTLLQWAHPGWLRSARSTGSPGLASSVSVSRYTVRSEMVSFSQLSASGGFRVQLRSSRNSDALTGTSFFREGNRGRPGRPGAERVRMSCRFGLFSFPTLEPSQKQASSVFVRTNQVHDASPWKHRRTLRNIPQKEPYPELTAPHNGFPFAKEQQDFFVQGTLQHPTLAAEVIHMRVIYNSSPGFVVPFPLRKKLWLESSSSDADLQEHVPGTPQLLYLHCATEL